MRELKLVLISGAPRSGTTLLRNLLNLHDNVFVLHEIALTAPRSLITEAEKLLTGQPFMSSDTHAAPVDDPDDETLLDRFYAERDGKQGSHPARPRIGPMWNAIGSWLSGKPDLHLFGTKLPLAFWNFGEIKHLLHDDEIKTIFIVRDPVDVVNSSMRRRWNTVFGKDDWHIGNVQAACLEWRKAWDYIVERHAMEASRTKIISYHDLCAAPEACLQSLISFLDLPETLLSHNVAEVPATVRQSFLSKQEAAYVSQYFCDLPELRSEAQVFAAMERRPKFFPLIEDGKQIMLSSGESDTYCLSGFFDAEEWGRWSGPEASLAFAVEGPGQHLVEIQLNRAFDDGSGSAICSYCVNGGPQTLFDGLSTSNLLIEIDVPEPIGKARAVEILFRARVFKQPHHQPFHDERALALAILWLRVTQKDPFFPA